jgi:hypothetical protein
VQHYIYHRERCAITFKNRIGKDVAILILIYCNCKTVVDVVNRWDIIATSMAILCSLTILNIFFGRPQYTVFTEQRFSTGMISPSRWMVPKKLFNRFIISSALIFFFFFYVNKIAGFIGPKKLFFLFNFIFLYYKNILKLVSVALYHINLNL